MFATRFCTVVLTLAVLTGTTAKTQTPSFTPDVTFQGSSLAGWHTLGQAAWSASNGVDTGDGGVGHGAGWLMLGPTVLYAYRTVRDKSAPGGARFVPELIHNRSGVGSDVLAVDLNGDGAIDIVTSTRSGTYIFWGTPNGTHQKK